MIYVLTYFFFLLQGIRSRGFARNPLTNLWSGNPRFGLGVLFEHIHGHIPPECQVNMAEGYTHPIPFIYFC